jgi:hypothetical protein
MELLFCLWLLKTITAEVLETIPLALTKTRKESKAK